MERSQGSAQLPLGSKLPKFELKATNGSKVSSSSFANDKVVLVVFTCNHCPYVKGSEMSLIDVAKKYVGQGLKVITISSNDASKYPEDSFEKMQEKERELKLPYLYLYDETQAVAKLFDAQCTPECYLFTAKNGLVYHGTINDSLRDASKVKRVYLDEAVREALETGTVSSQFVAPLGCSIKWKT